VVLFSGHGVQQILFYLLQRLRLRCHCCRRPSCSLATDVTLMQVRTALVTFVLCMSVI